MRGEMEEEGKVGGEERAEAMAFSRSCQGSGREHQGKRLDEDGREGGVISGFRRTFMVTSMGTIWPSLM